MKSFLIIGALLISALTSFANIGDTLAETCKRWGQPRYKESGYTIWYFPSESMSAQVKFTKEGYCNELIYCMPGTLTRKQIEREITDNFGSIDGWKDWVIQPIWYWRNPKLDSVLYTEHKDGTFLLMITQHSS